MSTRSKRRVDLALVVLGLFVWSLFMFSGRGFDSLWLAFAGFVLFVVGGVRYLMSRFQF